MTFQYSGNNPEQALKIYQQLMGNSDTSAQSNSVAEVDKVYPALVSFNYRRMKPGVIEQTSGWYNNAWKLSCKNYVLTLTFEKMFSPSIFNINNDVHIDGESIEKFLQRFDDNADVRKFLKEAFDIEPAEHEQKEELPQEPTLLLLYTGLPRSLRSLATTRLFLEDPALYMK